jgi:hypothetical protein
MRKKKARIIYICTFLYYAKKIQKTHRQDNLELSINENAPFQASFLGMITSELYRKHIHPVRLNIT